MKTQNKTHNQKASAPETRFELRQLDSGLWSVYDTISGHPVLLGSNLTHEQAHEKCEEVRIVGRSGTTQELSSRIQSHQEARQSAAAQPGKPDARIPDDEWSEWGNTPWTAELVAELERVRQERGELLDFVRAFCELVGEESHNEPMNELALLRLAKQARAAIAKHEGRAE